MGAGAGAVLISPTGQQVQYVARLDFKTTNTIAEYETVLLGLQKARALGVAGVIIRTNSQIVAGHANKNFQVQHSDMTTYLEAIHKAGAHFRDISI